MSFRLVFSLCSLVLSGCGAELSSETALTPRPQALFTQSVDTHGLERALPAAEHTVGRGVDFQVIGSIDGFFQHLQPGLVRGSVLLAVEDAAPGDVQLALRLHDGTAWVDHLVRDLSPTGPSYGEVEAVLPSSQEVRFEVRVRRRPLAERHVRVSFARLFGAECVPDFSQPGTCL